MIHINDYKGYIKVTPPTRHLHVAQGFRLALGPLQRQLRRNADVGVRPDEWQRPRGLPGLSLWVWADLPGEQGDRGNHRRWEKGETLGEWAFWNARCWNSQQTNGLILSKLSPWIFGAPPFEDTSIWDIYSLGPTLRQSWCVSFTKIWAGFCGS